MNQRVSLVAVLLIAVSSSAADAPPAKFKFAGLFVDDHLNPIVGAEVVATYAIQAGFGYIDSCKTDNAGWFVINRAKALSGASPGSIGDAPITIEISHADFLRQQLDNVEKLSAKERVNLHIIMASGQSLSGKVIDAAGKPIAGAMVVANFANDNDRKAVATAADGAFALRGLPPESCALQCRKITSDAQILAAGMSVDLRQLPRQVELAAKPFELPAGAVAHELFGMKLIDIDDTIRKQISLHSSSRVMVLEPGPNAARLGLDDLQAGDAFWMAGNKRIKNFADFAQTIVGECKAQQQRGETSFSVRVVYNFDRLDRDGSNTQHLKLTPDDLKELMKVAGP